MSAPRTLEEKQDEKGRLWKRYRVEKRAEWNALCEREPRLAAFRSALRRCYNSKPILLWLADSWLRRADADIRHAALRLIDRHAWRQAQFQGREALDDPLPPATNLFFLSRQLLEVR